MRDHVQNVVFDKIRMHLEQDGETDERLEAFGTFQRRLHQSGHHPSAHRPLSDSPVTLSHSLIIRAGSVLGTGCTEGSVQNAASTASPSRRARSARCSAPTNLQTRRNTARESSLSATYKNESGQDTRGSDVKWSG